MKKLLLTSLVAASSLFALTNDELKSVYTSALMPGTGVEIIERETLKEVPEIDRVVIEITSHGNSQRSVIFLKDDYIVSDLLDTKTGRSLAAEFNYKEQQRMALESFDNIVFSDKKELNEAKGIYSATIATKEGNVSDGDIVLMSGDYLVRDLIDPVTGKSFLGEYLLKQSNEKVGKIYKDEDQKYIIKLGNDDKKPTTIIFTDPKSAHSQDTINAAERLLEEANIEIVSLSLVGGNSSVAINAELYANMPKDANTSVKIETLKKYYTADANASEPSEADKKAMVELTSKYTKAGVTSLPRAIKKEDLNLK